MDFELRVLIKRKNSTNSVNKSIKSIKNKSLLTERRKRLFTTQEADIKKLKFKISKNNINREKEASKTTTIDVSKLNTLSLKDFLRSHIYGKMESNRSKQGNRSNRSNCSKREIRGGEEINNKPLVNNMNFLTEINHTSQTIYNSISASITKTDYITELNNNFNKDNIVNENYNIDNNTKNDYTHIIKNKGNNISISNSNIKNANNSDSNNINESSKSGNMFDKDNIVENHTNHNNHNNRNNNINHNSVDYNSNDLIHLENIKESNNNSISSSNDDSEEQYDNLNFKHPLQKCSTDINKIDILQISDQLIKKKEEQGNGNVNCSKLYQHNISRFYRIEKINNNVNNNVNGSIDLLKKKKSDIKTGNINKFNNLDELVKGKTIIKVNKIIIPIINSKNVGSVENNNIIDDNMDLLHNQKKKSYSSQISDLDGDKDSKDKSSKTNSPNSPLREKDKIFHFVSPVKGSYENPLIKDLRCSNNIARNSKIDSPSQAKNNFRISNLSNI